MATNANLNVVVATASTFKAEDRNDPRFYIVATLASGVLRFEVVARMDAGERGSVSGKMLFAEMMNHFGARIRIIEGNWTQSSGLATNLEQFNRAISAGLSPEEAAGLTWTGMRASDYGYNQVNVIQALPSNTQGSFLVVRVQFSP